MSHSLPRNDMEHSKGVPAQSGEAKVMELLSKAVGQRRELISSGVTQAYRAFAGAADGIDGLFIDVYGAGAAAAMYEGRIPRSLEATKLCQLILAALGSVGVQAVYLKPFPRDRSKIGGELPPVVTARQPQAGEPLDEALVVREHGWKLEVRLYDGFSTGLFLDQRENRAFLAHAVEKMKRGRAAGDPVTVLNTFAYTCAFSVAAAMSGAATTSVDVSGRYLDWGRRNFEHNALDASVHRFAKMDTFEFLEYAARKGLRYDLIVLDPPSFASGNKRKGIRPWSSVSDYCKLVTAASSVLNRKGLILASTNTQELCKPGRLEREITRGLGEEPRWHKLPAAPVDYEREQERFAARAFTPV
ncbi:MAG: class I SAM-dependent methyltransferase [Planctomycetota bacterium]|nr:class I SAM-dependent methyltransferase [Planctomycetota bacterium]